MSAAFRFAFVALLALGGPLRAGDEELRIHLVSGSAEYKSEESLRQLQGWLEETCDRVSVTASWGADGGETLPGLEALAEADLVIIFARRMNLPREELKYLHDFFEAEKAAIGIRTSSHAFQGFLEMDAEIFGGSYSGHGPDEPVEVSVADEAGDHPILEGVNPWRRRDKIYRNPGLGPKTTPLLYGAAEMSGLEEPLAWTNRYGASGRAFYTSIGMPADFENENFRQMLLNVIEWATERKLPLKADLD